MRQIIRTAVLAAAGTAALGLAAPASASPAASCTRTVCRIVIYKGGGNKAPVGPASLPAADTWTVSTVPGSIETSGYGTLKFDVASLEGHWGDCASDCSEWWYDANPAAAQVSSFTYQASGKTVTGHAIQVPSGNQNWKDLGGGTWTPLYLVWEAAPAYNVDDCIALNIKTYTWTKETWGSAACPG